MGSDSRTTARETRTRTKADLSRALSRILYERDCTQGELAAATGASPAIVQRWCDRDRHETISLADVVSAPREVARDLLSWVADRLDLLVCERLRAEQSSDHLGHLARRAREHAETTAAIVAGLATDGGRFTDDELARLDREVRDEEIALAELRAWIDAQMRERRRGPTWTA